MRAVLLPAFVALLAFAGGAAVHEQAAEAKRQQAAQERAARAEQKRAERPPGKPRRIRYVRDGEVIATTFTAATDTEN